MHNIKIISSKDNYKGEFINTTSRSTNWSKGLSPFFLGPINLYDNYFSYNVENGWQFSKVYSEYADINGNPTKEYFNWAKSGWEKQWADRYPMGRGQKPLYSYWNGEKLSYIEARRKIYIPMYARAVVKSKAYKMLKEMYDRGDSLVLWDFDGYDYAKLDMTFEEVIDCEKKKMGHAFVLAMLLTGFCEVNDNKVVIHENKEMGYHQQSLL